MGSLRLHSQYSDSLWAGLSRDQIPVRARYSAAIQTGPGAHLTSCAMGTGSLSPEVKQLGHGINHTPLSSAKVKERVELYFTPCLDLHGLF
jgi:hypothetical protein